jgi:hypothetical protein
MCQHRAAVLLFDVAALLLVLEAAFHGFIKPQLPPSVWQLNNLFSCKCCNEAAGLICSTRGKIGCKTKR